MEGGEGSPSWAMARWERCQSLACEQNVITGHCLLTLVEVVVVARGYAQVEDYDFSS